jgi:hypothetical protein
VTSRALDQELDWYFSHAESALGRSGIGTLPAYAAARLPDPTDPRARDHAVVLAHVVRDCLVAMDPPHVEVLRAAYTPCAWPTNVSDVLGALAPVAVRIILADDPWPPGSASDTLEERAAQRLALAIARATISVYRLRNQSQTLLARAVGAYASLRATGTSALEVG